MSHDVARFYNAFAPFYPVLDIFLNKHKRKLADKINSEPSGRLLEIGVGRGEILKHYTDKELTGIDTSEGMLAFARKNAPKGCPLHVMDAANLEFPDGSFEYVVLSYVLSVVPDASKVMDEVHRVLTPGGKVYILNHESKGKLQQQMNKVLSPLVSKVLKFTTTFELDPAINPDKFRVAERRRSGVVPNISMLILEKPAEQ